MVTKITQRPFADWLHRNDNPDANPMPSFADNLESFSSVAALARLDLFDASGELVGRIENRPGQQGSLALYNHLRERHGRIDAAAAREGLALYAEHTQDARDNPGKHPNIDRLIAIAAGDYALEVSPVPAAAG